MPFDGSTPAADDLGMVRAGGCEGAGTVPRAASDGAGT